MFPRYGLDQDIFQIEQFKDSFGLMFSINAPNFNWMDNPYIRPVIYVSVNDKNGNTLNKL